MYSRMSGEFDQRRESYLKEHPDMMAASDWKGDSTDSMDWQKKMELEESVQIVGDMQLALQKEIR